MYELYVYNKKLEKTAETINCRFLHGNGISFRLTFKGELDDKN
jgi:hypothetical protein